MYDRLRSKLASGETILLDGGTGTEIQCRGVPMSGQTWCAEVNLTHPDTVRMVHVDYIRAGAEVVTANTFATSPLLFNALGRDGEIATIDATAVKLAREAVEEAGRENVAVAGSFSTMRPVPQGSDRTSLTRNWSEADARPLMRRKAEALAKAGVDLIIMEMMRDLDYSVWAIEAAVATGLPVWIGISVEMQENGRLVGFGRPEMTLDTIAPALAGLGGEACLIMHSDLAATTAALDTVRKHWKGPLGAYPESGYFEMPDWKFVDIVAEERLVEECLRWREQGATIFGGCCGIGPSHIGALGRALLREK
ncbi:MAG: homocysteine S-methyltransferase family protein [Parvibaculaceae bacterium]